MVEREWDDPNWSTGDTLTAQQFADHVTEGHFPSDELQFTITGSGDPAIVDAQNGSAEVLTYDRSAGAWVLGSLEAGSSIGNATYATLSDVPTTLPEGTQVYVEDENAIYVEDGT